MNESIVNQINRKLYAEGQIYWSWNKDWTSRLWLKLKQLGWKMYKSPAGFRYFIDNTGEKIETGHLSTVYALKHLAELMR